MDKKEKRRTTALFCIYSLNQCIRIQNLSASPGVARPAPSIKAAKIFQRAEIFCRCLRQP